MLMGWTRLMPPTSYQPPVSAVLLADLSLAGSVTELGSTHSAFQLCPSPWCCPHCSFSLSVLASGHSWCVPACSACSPAAGLLPCLRYSSVFWDQICSALHLDCWQQSEGQLVWWDLLWLALLSTILMTGRNIQTAWYLLSPPPGLLPSYCLECTWQLHLYCL